MGDKILNEQYFNIMEKIYNNIIYMHKCSDMVLDPNSSQCRVLGLLVLDERLLIGSEFISTRQEKEHMKMFYLIYYLTL